SARRRPPRRRPSRARSRCPGTWGIRWPSAALRRRISVQVAPELLALVRAVELLEGLRLDLADALPGQVHHLADLLERLRIGSVESEAQPQDLLLLGVELGQGV